MCHRLSLILYLLAGILFLPGAFAEDLEAKGYHVHEQEVDYEFVKGANQMLVVSHA